MLFSDDVELFFLPWVDQTLASLEAQLKDYPVKVSSRFCIDFLMNLYIWILKFILLVGGFGDSPYLHRRIQEDQAFAGIEVVHTNDST